MPIFIGKSTDKVGIGLESDSLSDFIDPMPFLKLGVRQELILIKTAMDYSCQGRVQFDPFGRLKVTQQNGKFNVSSALGPEVLKAGFPKAGLRDGRIQACTQTIFQAVALTSNIYHLSMVQ